MNEVIKIYDVGDKERFKALIWSEYSKKQLITIFEYIIKDLKEKSS